nr:hypothetical protein [uncultured Shimia sp.]
MAKVSVGSLLLVVFLVLQGGKVSAWNCNLPEALVFPTDETSLSEKEMLRFRSLALSKFLQPRQEADVVVFGQFFKNSTSPFLHEEQLESIRALYWPPSEDIQMPAKMEYTYFDALRFEGLQILDGELVPFIAESVDVRISILAENEGIVDALPPTGDEVIGVLRSPMTGRKSLEATASPCPTYLPVEPFQLADLLVCINNRECR